MSIQVRKIRYKIQVVIKYYSIQRSFFLNKIIYFFREVEYNTNHNDQCQSEKKCAQELSYDIVVNLFHPKYSIICLLIP